MPRLNYKSKTSQVPRDSSSVIDTNEQHPYYDRLREQVFVPLPDYYITIDLTDLSYEVGAYEG